MGQGDQIGLEKWQAMRTPEQISRTRLLPKTRLYQEVDI